VIRQVKRDRSENRGLWCATSHVRRRVPDGAADTCGIRVQLETTFFDSLLADAAPEG
jgi:hypothetical protein